LAEAPRYTQYRLRSPEGTVHEGSLIELSRQHGLNYETVKALAYGRQIEHCGWRCLEPRHKRTRARRSGCRHVLHRWRHKSGEEQVMTVAELVRHDPKVSAKSLYLVASGGIQVHHGWRWEGEVASWPRRLISVRGPSGEQQDRVPLDLLREEGLSVADVDALLAARPAAGWQPYLVPAAVA
jgi:hypothetical protein